jgi:hypothetical protein
MSDTAPATKHEAAEIARAKETGRIDSGWREVADTALELVRRFT